MAPTPGARVFDFFQLEERVLLSGDGFDLDDAAIDPQLELLESLADQLAGEGQADSNTINLPAGNLESSNADLAETELQGTANELTPRRIEVVFVDAGVENADQLIDGLRHDAESNVDWIVYRLSDAADGISQISDVLDDLAGVDAVHLFSHGNESGFQLGQTWVDQESLEAYAGEIAKWNLAFESRGDILIYGCDLASSDTGAVLLESLAALIDCDIAASDDPTGHATLGGDWDLEFRLGEIETEIAIGSAMQSAWLGRLDTPPSDIVITQTLQGGLSINETGNDTIFISSSGLASNLDQLTYEVQFFAEAFSGEHVFLSYNVGNEDHLSFQISNSGNRLELDIGAGSPIYSNALNYKTALTDGQDHTLSITWENTLGNWQVFLDGQIIDSGAGFQVGRQVLAGGTFVFGQEQDTQGGNYDSSQYFRGTLYEARLFGDIRTTAEIADNYAVSVESDEDALLSNWRFDAADVNGNIVDQAGSIGLIRSTVSGPGFTADNATLEFAVDEGSADGTVVGKLLAVDAERNAEVINLLSADPGLSYSSSDGKFYKLVSGSLTWDDAQKTAANTALLGISGQLATIRSAAENGFVAGIAAANSVDVWLGGSDQSLEGDFRWIEGGTDADLFWSGGLGGGTTTDGYANFESGQPDDFGGQDFLKLQHSDGSWRDESDSATASLVVEWDDDEVLDTSNPITYQILTQSVAGAFAVDADDGTITVADGSLLNFDALSTHTVMVRVTDVAGNTYDEAFVVELYDGNARPRLDVAGPLTVAEGATGAITTAVLSASDPDHTDSEIRYLINNPPSHGQLLVGGTPIGLGQSFTQQDIVDGRVTYAHDNSEQLADSITLTVSDGDTDLPPQTLLITVTPVNDQAPVITSDGGGDNASITVDENATAVTTVVANDADQPGDTILYSISGGDDASLFQMDAVAGTLEFVSAPDAESLLDLDRDGVYQVLVSASDGVQVDTQAISVFVRDVDEFDVGAITDINSNANQLDVSAAPGAAVAITANATDPDATNSSIVYSLTNDDGGRFSIDGASGDVFAVGNFDLSIDGPTRIIVVRATSADSSFTQQSFTVDLFRPNTAPTATGESFTTTASQTVVLSAPGVLANDADSDGDSLAAVLVNGPGNGTVTLAANGRFVYTPSAGFVGTDVFTYVADDGVAQSNLAQVQIQVIVGGGVTTPGGSGTGVDGSDNNNTGRSGGDTATDSDSGIETTTPAVDGGIGSANAGDGGGLDGASGSDTSSSSSQSEQDTNRQSEDTTSGGDGDTVAIVSGSDPSQATSQQADAGGSSGGEVVDPIEVENAAMLQLVYQSLFSSTEDAPIQIAESSQEIRQLERMLKLDLKQAILWDMWDNDDQSLENAPSTIFIGSAGAAAGFFSIGYVMWALRGGAFVSVLASSLPSWRIIDPTALLTAYRSTQTNPTEGLTEIVKQR